MMEGVIISYGLDLIYLNWGTGELGHWRFGLGYGVLGKRGIAERQRSS